MAVFLRHQDRQGRSNGCKGIDRRRVGNVSVPDDSDLSRALSTVRLSKAGLGVAEKPNVRTEIRRKIIGTW